MANIERLFIQVSPELKKELQSSADRENLSISEYVRKSIEKSIYGLSHEQQIQFALPQNTLINELLADPKLKPESKKIITGCVIMSDIRIEVHKGSYDTETSYNKEIGYITNKTYFGGYGFTYNPALSIIEQFKLSETYSSHTHGQKIWHFYITFSTRWNHIDLLNLANQIALIFSPRYQIVYGLDLDKGNPHLHFGLNTFSYYPDIPVITPKLMEDFLIYLQNELKKWYPPKTVTLQFQGKKG